MDLSPRLEGSLIEVAFPWKPAVISVSIVQFALETYICSRQLGVLRRWRVSNESSDRSWNVKTTKLRIWNSFLSTIQVVVLIGLDAIPALWNFAGDIEQKILEATGWSQLWLGNDFDRSAVFSVCCYVAFLLVNLPTYFYRTLVMKEKVIRDFYGRKNRNWGNHAIANGRPVYPILIFMGIWTLEFQAFGLKYDRSHVIMLGVLQASFVVLYPIVMQPKGKTLLRLESGQIKDTIKEMATAANFPLKRAYIIDDQDRQTIQVFGWPKKKYIAVPKIMMDGKNADEIIGMTAHAIGSWKHFNGFRVFAIGQVYFSLVWFYLTMFCSMRENYEEFGFQNEFPRMAAIVIFTIGFAPFLVAWHGFAMNGMEAKNHFIADKFAADLGYESALRNAIMKKQSAEGSGEADSWFSIYYNHAPTLSERLVSLEKVVQEKEEKAEGLVSLAGDEKKN